MAQHRHQLSMLSNRKFIWFLVTIKKRKYAESTKKSITALFLLMLAISRISMPLDSDVVVLLVTSTIN